MEGDKASISRKRRIFDDDRPISPPPLRRKLNSESELKKPSTSFEIISWNVNGVGPFLAAETPQITSFFNKTQTLPLEGNDKEAYSLRNFLRRHNWPEMLGLQEVKINPNDESTKRALKRAANVGEGPSYTAHFSLPRDRFNAKGFGGKVHGVCTLIRNGVDGGINGKIVTKEVDWDLEGRVLVTEFEKWKLAVVNGYWVNGTMNPYRNPNTGVIEGTRHDRKRQFHASMLDEVIGYEKRGWDVVLIGDMNVARTAIDGFPGIRTSHEHVKNRSDFNSKFFEDPKGMQGVDTFRYLHGEKRKYSYHGESAQEWRRSCDRVDLGIVSKRLVEERDALVSAEIWESVIERGHSDHVSISIVLDESKLRITFKETQLVV